MGMQELAGGVQMHRSAHQAVMVVLVHVHALDCRAHLTTSTVSRTRKDHTCSGALPHAALWLGRTGMRTHGERARTVAARSSEPRLGTHSRAEAWGGLAWPLLSNAASNIAGAIAATSVPRSTIACTAPNAVAESAKRCATAP